MKKLILLRIVAISAAIIIMMGCNNNDGDHEKDPTKEENSTQIDDKAKEEERVSDKDPVVATNVESGTLEDKRDGKSYKTVKIGNQTWMAENLNLETEESVCSQLLPGNCERYGRLYIMEEAKTACPDGWHLPSKEEWEYMIDFNGGKETAADKLKVDGESGFNALMGGFREWSREKEFYYREMQTFFWSSTTADTYNGWVIGMRKYDAEMIIDKFDFRYYFSCRCLKD